MGGPARVTIKNADGTTTRFRLQVSRDDLTVSYFWHAEGDSKLAILANDVDHIDSMERVVGYEVGSAVIAVVIHLPEQKTDSDGEEAKIARGRTNVNWPDTEYDTEYDLNIKLLINFAVSDSALSEVVTPREREFFKGLAMNTLCELIGALLELEEILPSTRVSLVASSFLWDDKQLGLVRYYLSYGFEFSNPDDLEQQVKSNNVYMQSTVARLLRACASKTPWRSRLPPRRTYRISPKPLVRAAGTNLTSIVKTPAVVSKTRHWGRLRNSRSVPFPTGPYFKRFSANRHLQIPSQFAISFHRHEYR